MKKVTDLKDNEVIHCKTKEEDIAICKLMHEAGLRWDNGESYLEVNVWDKYKENTCYFPANGRFSDLDYYTQSSKLIYPSSYFIEEFVLPEKWCIKITKENQDIVHEWKLKNTAFSTKTNINHYVNYSGSWGINSENTEITFKQFQKYVLKKEDKMEKEIIGYKLIKPEYKQAICAICGVIDFCFERLEKLQNINGGFTKLKEAGVLDLWFEPIYKLDEDEILQSLIDEFESKLGFKLEVGKQFSFDYGKSSYKNLKFKGYKLINRNQNVIDFSSLNEEWFHKNPKEEYQLQIIADIHFYSPDVKIAKIPDIEINDYKAIFYNNYVKFGCAEISKDVFFDLSSICGYKNTNREITKVTIGKGEFTIEQINEIVEYYKNRK